MASGNLPFIVLIVKLVVDNYLPDWPDRPLCPAAFNNLKYTNPNTQLYIDCSMSMASNGKGKTINE